MSNVSMECLIKSYQVFSNLFTIVEPVMKNDNPTIISFSNYVRSFCLDMIVRCDSTNTELRYFVNNLTLIALPEMDAEEYKYATTKYTFAHYDTYLFSEQPITKKILAYDKANGTHIMNDFCSQLCLIANIFSEQNENYKALISEFIKAFRQRLSEISSTNGEAFIKKEQSKTENKVTDTVNKQTFHPTPKATATQTKYTQKNDNDIQYFIRIILPMMIMLGFIIGAFVSEEYVMLLVAIIPLCFMIAGFKAAGRRCPQCGAWDSLKTIRSNCVGQQKVKVRRNLNSSYWRTSGTHTFGSRQVFVSADEYVYNEVYRCSVCGCETKGTRRVIDDGIR